LVFSTKDRRPLIPADRMPRLREYFGGIIRELGGRMFTANGPEDHIHIATILTQKLAVMEVLRIIKANSSKWIHETFSDMASFAWQDQYAGFTFAQSGTAQVVAYIDRQIEHHRKVTFQEELIALLEKHEIPYDPKYIWK
jgi:REP element-mobilizing transposase RayT